MEGGKLLRKWRSKQRPPLSQADAGKKFDCRKATVSRIETGERNPSLALAAKISDVTKIPIARFVRNEAQR